MNKSKTVSVWLCFLSSISWNNGDKDCREFSVGLFPELGLACPGAMLSLSACSAEAEPLSLEATSEAILSTLYACLSLLTVLTANLFEKLLVEVPESIILCLAPVSEVSEE